MTRDTILLLLFIVYMTSGNAVFIDQEPTPRPGHTMSLGIGTIFYFSPLSTVSCIRDDLHDVDSVH